jgi:F-type H+-transporting ATPase subunit epsilon
VKLKVLLPNEVLLAEEVVKVVAEAPNGQFCLLPRHIDLVSTLVPGLLAYVKAGTEAKVYIGVAEGLLVKCGPEVLVATFNAVQGPRLGQLREIVTHQFKTLSHREKQARSALAHLEANFIRRFLKMQEYAGTQKT